MPTARQGITANALSQLPEDGNVLDDILTLDDDLDGGDATDSGPLDGEGLDDNDALEFHHCLLLCQTCWSIGRRENY